MGVPRKQVVLSLGAVAAVLMSGAAVAVVLARSGERNKSVPEAQARADERETEEGAVIAVKAIHPHKDASLRITVKQLLSVKPFFEIGLQTQVAGVVSKVPKSIGAHVRKGDLLVEIAVPDLDQEVLQKAAVIQQRLKDVEVAKAAVVNAQAQIAVATELIVERIAEKDEAVATADYRKLVSDRFAGAVLEKGIQQTMADEAQRNYRAGTFAVEAAKSIISKAKADLKEKESLLIGARADVELKESLVEVARKDYARAQALAGYARISAPWSGEVVSSNVVEGTFVQNASTAHTEPMLTLARTDIVTVVMKVPDIYSRYVTRDTEAIVQFDDLPGVEMHGSVTRFSKSIQDRDRTMRVEVDLWNDTPERYRKFAAKCVATWLAPLTATGPLQAAPLLTAGDQYWSKNSKDRSDPFPVLPIVTGSTDAPPKILAGASGYMRLNLQQFHGAYLLPSSAVFNRGGKPYILEVRDGKSYSVPVRIQVNDGLHAKIAVIVQNADPTRGIPERLGNLRGTETIILNRQVEIGDGQAVEVNLED